MFSWLAILPRSILSKTNQDRTALTFRILKSRRSTGPVRTTVQLAGETVFLTDGHRCFGQNYVDIAVRQTDTILRVNGELWNQAEVLDYLRKVYNADSIISYDRDDVKPADIIKIVLDKLKNDPNDSIFQEAEEELLQICKAEV